MYCIISCTYIQHLGFLGGGGFRCCYLLIFCLFVCLFAVLANLCEREYVRPSPVQMQTVPAALAGRDLLVCATTGSGKSESVHVW